MGVSTSAGTRLYIGTTALVGLTDTFTEIGEVGSIPEFGRVYKETVWTPLNSRGEQKYKGSYNDGGMTVPIGKDSSDAGQAACIIALDDDNDYNFKIVANDDVAPVALTGVSMTSASPGIATKTAHGLAANTPIKFTAGSGTLPTGIVDGTTYYVKTVLTADTFTVSATSGGTVINTTGSPSGTYTVTTVPEPTSQYLKAKVMSYTTKYDDTNAIVMSSVQLSIKSGSIVDVAKSPTA